MALSNRCLILPLFFVAGLLSGSPVAAAEHGQPLWYDLVSEDAAVAARFYEGLFGWEIGRSRDGVQPISNNGRQIAGLVQIKDTMRNASESQWLVGIVVDDLDLAVKATLANGGMVLREITEVPGSGRYAVIKDPQGAPLMLGTPTREIGGPRENGSFAWVELWSDDVDAAALFYGAVIGYERNAVDRPGGGYTVFESGGTPRAGLVPTPHEDVDPVWAPYVGVSDLAATLKRTTDLGGRVVLEPREDFGGGRVALIEDPVRAMIFVAQLPNDGEGSR